MCSESLYSYWEFCHTVWIKDKERDSLYLSGIVQTKLELTPLVEPEVVLCFDSTTEALVRLLKEVNPQMASNWGMGKFYTIIKINKFILKFK